MTHRQFLVIEVPGTATVQDLLDTIDPKKLNALLTAQNIQTPQAGVILRTDDELGHRIAKLIDLQRQER